MKHLLDSRMRRSIATGCIIAGILYPNLSWSQNKDSWGEKVPRTGLSVSFVSPQPGARVSCIRGADALYKCATSGKSSGVVSERYTLLLWARPVSPPSETSGWYLQRGQNGVSMTGSSGAWKGVAQLGNQQYPPHDGDTVDLAITVTDIETAAKLKSEAGVVVRDDPVGKKTATQLGVAVSLQK